MKCISRALRISALILLALIFGTRAGQAQSCSGKVAGDVCRPSAGGCDVAETCVATGGSAGNPMFQPVDGTLATDVAWNYNMGYTFTPNKTIVVTALGGFFNGTKTVYLYDRSTGAVLASASVTAANNWAYAAIAPVTLNANVTYSVAVYLAGSGAAYRYNMTAMPRAFADGTINGSCYRSGSTSEPCSYSGVIPTTNYGMADLKYLPAKGLYQPTDGTLYTDVAGDYTAGYAFTPNKNLTVTSLGGLFNGTRTVYLYNRSTGAVLASASVTSANSYVYTRITPVTLTAGTSYTVAVYLPGTGGAYRAGMTSMPSVLADASIEGTCYRPASTAEPCAYTGLISGTNYGMADIKYTATGGGLVCPADSFLSAGSVCRGASGTCDVAETCSGASAACPSNLFKASGVSCDDGQLCTYNDVCNGAGSCGGTTITCGGGDACSTTVCNGTSTCEPAKVFCDVPPGECYNTLGTCNASNGSCSYTVKVGAPCGSRGTCQASGACYTPPPVTTNSVPADCATQTIPVPTPIGCDSCDPSRPCVVDATETVPAEYQTCSGYTPRKGDIVVHEAQGLTQLLVSNFGSNWTHIGVFLGPQQGSNAQLVRHQALNLDGLSKSVIRADTLQSLLIALSLNKNSAYCKSAKINPLTLFDSGQFMPGVPNTHTADMITEPDGNGTGGLYWETGVVNRQLIIAANRAVGQQVADGMLARNDYYSLNSLVDWSKGMSRLSNGKPGTNCASAIMSCISPQVPATLLKTDKMRETAYRAYEAIRREVRHRPETESAVTKCKNTFGCFFGLPCPVDCDGLAWETANGIADQVIACFLFGPTANGCECTRDNRKWHFASWAGSAPTGATQDDLDWLNRRLTDVEYQQDTWTPTATSNPPVTIYESYSYLPGDVMKSGNYPPSNAYPLIRKTNATRKYGHCYVPLTITGVTPSPASANYGTTLTWTVTTSGGDPSTIQYALFRRRSGTSNWIPDVTAPSWQSSNVLSWTPGSTDVATWEIYVWVKDRYTAANANTYGYAAGANAGPVQITNPPAPLAFSSCTPSPSSVTYGTTITWTCTVSGGTPSTTKFAFFRRRGGTSNWIPDVTAPNWQTSNSYSWTPTSSDVASWETYVWVKDGNTPANANTYGYAAGYNTGVVQVKDPGVVQAYPAKGWVDGYNTQHIWGWACDPDYPTQSNRVDVYTTGGQYIGSANANIGSVSAINSACLGGTSHYFDLYPSGGVASGTHFNVWSIDLPYATPGNDNRKLGGSGSIGDGTEFVIP
jgi:hypothetical protein